MTGSPGMDGVRAAALATALLLGGAAVGGCQTAQVEDGPAVLSGGDGQSLSRLRSALAAAVNRAQVTLGPEDPTKSSRISVLPPPVHRSEDRSLAMPTHFSIRLQNGSCVLVREDTGAVTPAPDLACRPAP